MCQIAVSMRAGSRRWLSWGPRGGDAAEAGAEVGPRVLGAGHRCGAECALQVGVAGWVRVDFILPAGLVAAYERIIAGDRSRRCAARECGKIQLVLDDAPVEERLVVRTLPRVV